MWRTILPEPPQSNFEQRNAKHLKIQPIFPIHIKFHSVNLIPCYSPTLHCSLPLAHSLFQSPKTDTFFSSVSPSTHGTLFLLSPSSHVKLVSFFYILLFWVIAEMDATITPGLYPFHRCKTLHLVRHIDAKNSFLFY